MCGSSCKSEIPSERYMVFRARSRFSLVRVSRFRFARSVGCYIVEEELGGGSGISHLRLRCFRIYSATQEFSTIRR